jgi:hypothetical protein
LARSLPAGEAYVSLLSVHAAGGTSWSEPPIDGPRLLVVTSGEITLRTQIAGASVFHGIEPNAPEDVPPGEDRLVAAGSAAVIPAGIPASLSNRALGAASWVQAQIETPATICPCGADFSRVRRVLLASETTRGPLESPALVVLERISSESRGAPSPLDPGAVRLIGVLDVDAEIERDEDRFLASGGHEPAAMFILTVAPLHSATDS